MLNKQILSAITFSDPISVVEPDWQKKDFESFQKAFPNPIKTYALKLDTICYEMIIKSYFDDSFLTSASTLLSPNELSVAILKAIRQIEPELIFESVMLDSSMMLFVSRKLETNSTLEKKQLDFYLLDHTDIFYGCFLFGKEIETETALAIVQKTIQNCQIHLEENPAIGKFASSIPSQQTQIEMIKENSSMSLSSEAYLEDVIKMPETTLENSDYVIIEDSLKKLEEISIDEFEELKKEDLSKADSKKENTQDLVEVDDLKNSTPSSIEKPFEKAEEEFVDGKEFAPSTQSFNEEFASLKKQLNPEDLFKEKTYQQALQLLNQAQTIADFKVIQDLFSTINGYNQADDLADLAGSITTILSEENRLSQRLSSFQENYEQTKQALLSNQQNWNEIQENIAQKKNSFEQMNSLASMQTIQDQSLQKRIDEKASIIETLRNEITSIEEELDSLSLFAFSKKKKQSAQLEALRNQLQQTENEKAAMDSLKAETQQIKEESLNHYLQDLKALEEEQNTIVLQIESGKLSLSDLDTEINKVQNDCKRMKRSSNFLLQQMQQIAKKGQKEVVEDDFDQSLQMHGPSLEDAVIENQTIDLQPLFESASFNQPVEEPINHEAIIAEPRNNAKEELISTFESTTNQLAFLNDLLYYKPEQENRESIDAYMKEQSDLKKAKEIAWTLKEKAREDQKPLINIAVLKYFSDPSYVDESFAYLENHDWKMSQEASRVLSDVLKFILLNDYTRPASYYAQMELEDSLPFELALVAGKYYSNIGQYQKAHDFLKKAEEAQKRSNYLLSNTSAFAQRNLDEANRLLARYENGKPYWPLTEKRRSMLIPFYEKAGISIPGSIKAVAKTDKIKEADFKPLTELDQIKTDRYVSFWISSIYVTPTLSDPYLLSAIKVENGKVIDTFERLIKPRDGISKVQQAAKRLSIDPAEFEKTNSWKQSAEEFLQFINDLPLISMEALTSQGRVLIRFLRYSSIGQLDNPVLDIFDAATQLDDSISPKELTSKTLLQKCDLPSGKTGLEKALVQAKVYEKLKGNELND